MKFFSYPYYFTLNIYNLFKFLLKSKQVYWENLSGNIIRCEIDKQTKLYGNYNLSDVTIGKGTYIATNARVSNTSIGKFCSIGPNIVCGWGLHPINGISTSPVFYSTKKQAGFTYSDIDKSRERESIQIGNDVFIGSDVTILDGITIGDGAVIGAGAVVSKNIPPYAVAVGCPIQIIKYRFEPAIIKELLEIKWWDQDENLLKELEKKFFEVEIFLQNHK